VIVPVIVTTKGKQEGPRISGNDARVPRSLPGCGW
jgi:hypothetical protein